MKRDPANRSKIKKLASQTRTAAQAAPLMTLDSAPNLRGCAALAEARYGPFIEMAEGLLKEMKNAGKEKEKKKEKEPVKPAAALSLFDLMSAPEPDADIRLDDNENEDVLPSSLMKSIFEFCDRLEGSDLPYAIVEVGRRFRADGRIERLESLIDAFEFMRKGTAWLVPGSLLMKGLAD